MAPIPFAARFRWIARHPLGSLRLLAGYSLRDLILRDDLRRMGRPVDRGLMKGLGRSNLNVRTVERLAETFRGREPATLLDAGASNGEFSAAAGLAFPGITIHAFEPLPDSFEALRRTLARFPGSQAWPFALGSVEETATIHRSANPGSSSLRPLLARHETAFPGTAPVGEETVRVRRLDDVMDEAGAELRPPVLFKIDVQGTEDRVLEGAERTLSRVDTLLVELSLVELFRGQPLFDEVRSRIEARGFAFKGRFAEIASPADGEVLQIDGLFERA